MTREQEQQISGAKARANSLLLGGLPKAMLRVELRREGWPAAAVEAALEEIAPLDRDRVDPWRSA